jgi:DNA repair exonuclease SbcCD ATPase subunit
MAISATITTSRFGTSHDAAYLKIIKTTTDYLTKKSCSHVAVYDSIVSYLQGAQPMYIEKVNYDEEYVQDTWGSAEEATPPRQTAYRASRDKIKNIADYSNIVNIYDYGFEGGGSLTSEEREELIDTRAELSNVEEHLISLNMLLASETERKSVLEPELAELTASMDVLTKDIDEKKSAHEGLKETLDKASEKMTNLKQAFEESGSKEDEDKVAAQGVVLQAAEDAYAEAEVELKQKSKERAELDKSIEETQANLSENSALVEDLTKEIADVTRAKDEVSDTYGRLIAKDATAKFTENSMQKQKEVAEHEGKLLELVAEYKKTG